MHTPAHLAASLLLYRNQPGRLAAAGAALGAVLPDLPMFGFYGYEKFVLGTSDHVIFSERYFDPGYQLFFDIFNSAPLFAAMLALCLWRRWRVGALIAGSALLHIALDLPVHHDDAHRHFLPFTNWRFASPVSYWDPAHHGVAFAIAEGIGAIAACIYVVRKGKSRPMRGWALGTLVFYAIGLVLAAALLLPRLF